jgi:hypothetical protein
MALGQVHISRMEAYQRDRCGLMRKPEPGGELLRSWTDLPRGFEDLKERDYGCGYGELHKDGQWFDVQGLPGFALPVPPSAGIGNQSSGDFSVQTESPRASYSSGTSYDCNSTGNVDSAEDASLSLSSYLMDQNVRAILKKVTVNEGALNQTIQSLGGGEKGLKELVGYIMLWVKEHNGENCDNFFSSQNLKKLHPPQHPFGYSPSSPAPFNSYEQRSERLNRTFERVQSSDDALDLNQFYQRAKSRRLMDDSEVDSTGRGTFVDVRGSIPDEFRFPKLEMSGGQMMLSGLEMQQRSVPCLQPSLSFASGQDGLSRTLAATTRAARRNRIARQRQSVHLSRTPSSGTVVSSGSGLWSVAPPAVDSRAMFHPQLPSGVPAGTARKMCNMDMLTFLLQKELRPSDVGNLGRIILPKVSNLFQNICIFTSGKDVLIVMSSFVLLQKEAEMHLPILALREGISLQMEDFDSGYCWNIRYR